MRLGQQVAIGMNLIGCRTNGMRSCWASQDPRKAFFHSPSRLCAVDGWAELVSEFALKKERTQLDDNETSRIRSWTPNSNDRILVWHAHCHPRPEPHCVRKCHVADGNNACTIDASRGLFCFEATILGPRLTHGWSIRRSD